jgi:hypothetical protein
MSASAAPTFDEVSNFLSGLSQGEPKRKLKRNRAKSPSVDTVGTPNPKRIDTVGGKARKRIDTVGGKARKLCLVFDSDSDSEPDSESEPKLPASAKPLGSPVRDIVDDVIFVSSSRPVVRKNEDDDVIFMGEFDSDGIEVITIN